MQHFIEYEETIKQLRLIAIDYRQSHLTCDEDLCLNEPECGIKCAEHCTSIDHFHCARFDCLNTNHYNGVCIFHCVENGHVHCADFDCADFPCFVTSKCILHCTAFDHDHCAEFDCDQPNGCHVHIKV